MKNTTSSRRNIPAIAAAEDVVELLGGTIEEDDGPVQQNLFMKRLEFDMPGKLMHYNGLFEVKQQHDRMNLVLWIGLNPLPPFIEKEFYRLLNEFNRIVYVGTFLYKPAGPEEYQLAEISHVTPINLNDGKADEADVKKALKDGQTIMDGFFPAMTEFLQASPIYRINTQGKLLSVRPGVSVEKAAEFILQGNFGRA